MATFARAFCRAARCFAVRDASALTLVTGDAGAACAGAATSADPQTAAAVATRAARFSGLRFRGVCRTTPDLAVGACRCGVVRRPLASRGAARAAGRGADPGAFRSTLQAGAVRRDALGAASGSVLQAARTRRSTSAVRSGGCARRASGVLLSAASMPRVIGRNVARLRLCWQIPGVAGRVRRVATVPLLGVLPAIFRALFVQCDLPHMATLRAVSGPRRSRATVTVGSEGGFIRARM